MPFDITCIYAADTCDKDATSGLTAKLNVKIAHGDMPNPQHTYAVVTGTAVDSLLGFHLIHEYKAQRENVMASLRKFSVHGTFVVENGQLTSMQ